jgi:hypothetical protein
MLNPSALVPVVRIGSMLGSTGSMYGGRKMRPAFAPCWCTSFTICGFHGVYSESTVSRVSRCVKAYQSRLLSCPV